MRTQKTQSASWWNELEGCNLGSVEATAPNRNVYAGISAELGQLEVWRSAKQAWKRLSELKQVIKN